MSRVFVLSSGNIFRNLAFETCLTAAFNKTNDYPQFDLLLWRSDPCVVIGRFQNAWREVNVQLLRSKGWPLARRQSGGGAVFHDRGNLNISFIERRKSLDRLERMELLQSVLQPLCTQYYVHVGPRFDLWVSDRRHPTAEDMSTWLKISGSSSRLGSVTAYHHCTLLCNANLQDLTDMLKPTFSTLQTKATQSIRSNVVNLNLDVEVVQRAVIAGFLEWVASKCAGNSQPPRVIYLTGGEENQYVDAEAFQRELQSLNSWSWIYGASPDFQIDLTEFEPSLCRIGRPLVACQRGGVVQSLRGLSSLESRQTTFLHYLSESLSGASCRSHSWNGILDRIVATWYIERPSSESLTLYQELIVAALRQISDKL